MLKEKVPPSDVAVLEEVGDIRPFKISKNILVRGRYIYIHIYMTLTVQFCASNPSKLYT